jgi:hypothetical protein
VADTTLFRFFVWRRPLEDRLAGGRRFQTDRLNRPTVEKLAAALKENPGWLLSGVGARQLGFWPLLTPEDVAEATSEPLAPLRLVLQLLEALQDPGMQRKAARTCVAAVLAEAFDAKCLLPFAAYQALVGLDVANSDDQKVG